MAKVKVSRNPMSFRPRALPTRIVVDAEDEERGDVGVTICEIPKGLLEDLRQDVADATDQVKELNAQILDARRNNAEELARELKKKRSSARAEVKRLQKSVVGWGVCGHHAPDFEDEDTGALFEFEGGTGEYDGVRYLVASSGTLEAYASVGDSFIQSLYFAVLAYQQTSQVRTPREVWDDAKKLKDLVAKRVKERVDAELAKFSRGQGGNVATPETDEEKPVAGEEEAPDPDPFAKRERTTRTTESPASSETPKKLAFTA